MDRSSSHPVVNSAINNKVENILKFAQQHGSASATQKVTDKIGALLHFAETLAGEGNFESAFIQVQRAYTIAPSHPEIPVVEQRIKSLQMKVFRTPAPDVHIPARRNSGKSDPYEEYVERFDLSQQPKEIKVLICQTEYHRERGDKGVAEEYLAQAFAIDPLNEAVLAASMRLSNSNPDTAVPSRGIVQRIEHLINEKDFSAAEALLNDAFLQDPLNEQFHHLESVLRLEQKVELTAVEEHLLYAGRMFREEKFEKALQEVRLGMLIDPLNDRLAGLERSISAALGERGSGN